MVSQLPPDRKPQRKHHDRDARDDAEPFDAAPLVLVSRVPLQVTRSAEHAGDPGERPRQDEPANSRSFRPKLACAAPLEAASAAADAVAGAEIVTAAITAPVNAAPGAVTLIVSPTLSSTPRRRVVRALDNRFLTASSIRPRRVDTWAIDCPSR